MRSYAVSLAVESLGRGMKVAIFENMSTLVRIVVFPSEGESPVTKSKKI